MANDVINIVTILGNSFDVQEVMKVLVNDKNMVSFDSFIPMPSDIKATKKSVPTAEMKLDLLDKYGVSNWVDWSSKYWGTQFDALETVILKHNKVRFFTDSNCPYEAINTLSIIFPNVKIKLQWADEDLGYNVGEMYLQNGDIIDTKSLKGGSDEAYEMAIIITDDKFYITDFLYSIEEDEKDEEFPSMCIRLSYKFRVLDEMFPSFILKQFEEWAVREEDYEFANEITKILK
jgi:hypothetical protein